MSGQPLDPVAGAFLGVVPAAALVLALPAALLVHSRRGRWFERTAAAGEERRTACVVAGAGTILLAWVAVALLAQVRALQAVAFLVLLLAFAEFLFGFAAGSWNQGRRMLRRDGGTACLVVGWLARAGAMAVPALWPAVAVYLVCAACGAPVVALLAGSSGNATTEPSPGSSAAR